MCKAQDENSDTLILSTVNQSTLDFFLDDIFVTAGMTVSNLYYSQLFRNLNYDSGLSFGVEKYFPMRGLMFMSTGLKLTERNFAYRHQAFEENVRNVYLNAPVSFSIELPVLKKLDLRFLLGANVGYRLNSKINRVERDADDSLKFQGYRINDFHDVDFGWVFGFSTEYRDFFFRAKSYYGYVKLYKNDQGMIHSFNFDLGCFLFRNIKSKKKK